MEWRKANLHKKDLPPLSSTEQYFIKFDEGRQKETGGRNLIIDLLENGWLDVEWLDEDTKDAEWEGWKLTKDEMLNLFRAGAGYALNQFKEPNAKQYFKEQFNIDL